MRLYRYISLERFAEMICKKELYFANPFLDWSDKREGFLYRYAQAGKCDSFLDRTKYGEEIKRQLRSGCLYKEDRHDDVLDWFGMRCLCWCKTRCSDRMAKEYKADVCIEIDSACLLSLQFEEHKVEGFSVEYDDNVKPGRIVEALGNSGTFNFATILKMKSKNYSFENEYRSYITLLDSRGHFLSNHNGIKVPINMQINNFVESVYLCRTVTPPDALFIREMCNVMNIHIGIWANGEKETKQRQKAYSKF